MKAKDLCLYTLKEFQKMELFNSKKRYTDIIFVPMDNLHDSGFRCMKFILVNRGEIVAVVSGWSDVAHINGIGGYGKNWETTIKTQLVPRIGWNIDCLTKSGCIRLFSDWECESEEFIGSDFSFYPILLKK